MRLVRGTILDDERGESLSVFLAVRATGDPQRPTAARWCQYEVDIRSDPHGPRHPHHLI